MTRKQKRKLIRILTAALLFLLLYLIPTDGWLRLSLYLAVYLLIGYDILRKAFLGILHLQWMDECFLMTVATVGAFVLAYLKGDGEYAEGVAVMLFYQIGEWFESYAVGRSRKSISALMEIRPDYANLVTETSIEKKDPEEIEIGSVIVVYPGERVPIDGTVILGETEADLSALNGESLPQSLSPGDRILSGSVNLTGEIRIRTEKRFGESTASKILDLVENAESRKSRSENFISRFSKIYTPAVCAGALLLAVLPPLFNLLRGADGQWTEWIYRALTFLVISCPCALVISVPLTFFAGIGGAGKAGILIKGSGYLETLSNVKTVVLDKTGTLTKGNLVLKDIHHARMPREETLFYAAHAEYASSHPIGQSIRRAYGKELDPSIVSGLRETAGNGVSATVSGQSVLIGNRRYLASEGIETEECSEPGTIVHMTVDGTYAGHLVIADEVKENAKESLNQLKKEGVRQIVMLTGDRAGIADKIAEELGIDEVRSELLPGDKLSSLEEILGKTPGKEKVAFVGDGMNDAPTLARADVGIAMGALGSDAAIEAADVVLMDDDPEKIPKAIRIARKTMRIVRENLIFAIGVKAVCLILGALGLANLWLAVFADVGVMVLAVLNALRALRTGK